MEKVYWGISSSECKVVSYLMFLSQSTVLRKEEPGELSQFQVSASRHELDSLLLSGFGIGKIPSPSTPGHSSQRAQLTWATGELFTYLFAHLWLEVNSRACESLSYNTVVYHLQPQPAKAPSIKFRLVLLLLTQAIVLFSPVPGVVRFNFGFFWLVSQPNKL